MDASGKRRRGRQEERALLLFLAQASPCMHPDSSLTFLALKLCFLK
jgi:hypothetical protein